MRKVCPVFFLAFLALVGCGIDAEIAFSASYQADPRDGEIIYELEDDYDIIASAGIIPNGGIYNQAAAVDRWGRVHVVYAAFSVGAYENLLRCGVFENGAFTVNPYWERVGFGNGPRMAAGPAGRNIYIGYKDAASGKLVYTVFDSDTGAIKDGDLGAHGNMGGYVFGMTVDSNGALHFAYGGATVTNARGMWEKEAFPPVPLSVSIGGPTVIRALDGENVTVLFEGGWGTQPIACRKINGVWVWQLLPGNETTGFSLDMDIQGNPYFAYGRYMVGGGASNGIRAGMLSPEGFFRVDLKAINLTEPYLTVDRQGVCHLYSCHGDAYYATNSVLGWRIYRYSQTAWQGQIAVRGDVRTMVFYSLTPAFDGIWLLQFREK